MTDMAELKKRREPLNLAIVGARLRMSAARSAQSAICNAPPGGLTGGA